MSAYQEPPEASEDQARDWLAYIKGQILEQMESQAKNPGYQRVLEGSGE